MGNKRTGSFGAKIGSAVGVAVIAIWAMLQVGVHTLQSNDAYTCENLAPEMLSLSKKNAAQSNGITLIGIVDKKPFTATSTLVECRGKAKWSNGAEGPLAFKAYLEDGQWWLSYSPD